MSFRAILYTVTLSLVLFVFSHRDDLRIELWRQGRSIRLPAEQLVEGLHGTRRHQLWPEKKKNPKLLWMWMNNRVLDCTYECFCVLTTWLSVITRSRVSQQDLTAPRGNVPINSFRRPST